jgi:small subunit ribosomal protein S8
MTDPITDMLNRITNAQAVAHPTVDVPFSKLKYEIAKLLKSKGFIKKVEKKGRKINKVIEITLKYTDKIPDISGFKRISKPGQRIYVAWNKIRRVRSGFGMAMLSTSQGLMSNEQARKQKIGGEILFEIW